MILHPGILALLGISALVLAVVISAGGFAVKILYRWNPASSSDQQLLLERRTWLVSSLLNYALVAQVLTALLFVFTAEDIHPLFIGAMCATGALNANLIGWLVLLLKIALVFFSAIWVVFNRLDQRTEDYPLIRMKYIFLLLLIPLLGADLYCQWLYFTGLRPEVITSCCGSLFSAQGESVAADLIALPARQTMAIFFTVAAGYFVTLVLTLALRLKWLRSLLFVAAVLFFFTSLAAVISFISLYIYQMPSHHCPFDMLQHHYNYIGYPLYIGLFLATLFALLPGLTEPFKQYQSLRREIERVETDWLGLALGGFALFMLCSCWQMVFGALKLTGY